MHFARLKLIFLVILIISSVGGFLNHKAYATTTSDGTVASSKKIASGTNGGPTLANFDEFGISVANIGDLNGNGVTDLAVGAISDDTGGIDRGAAYVLFLTAIITTPTSTGGGPRGDVSAPSFSLDIFTFSRLFPESVLDTIQDDPYATIEPIKDETIALPLVINENGYAISKYTNTIVTNTIETGNPVNVKLNLSDETGI
ncbi:MAG: integrin alpha, partial [Nitrosopumilaceae archaeon]